MTKQELEKKITNGESVWCIYQDEKEVDILPINKSMKWIIREDNLIVEEDWFYPIKYLFNSRAEAEHYLHHANITRIETLPFLTWEEFKKAKLFNFIDRGGKHISVKLFGDTRYITEKGLGEGAICIYINNELYSSYRATEENFYKAYDECVRLFKGE